MAELLEPVNGMMCRMTEVCQQMMTKPGKEKYVLTHQILYTVVAEMVNISLSFCIKQIFWILYEMYLMNDYGYFHHYL